MIYKVNELTSSNQIPLQKQRLLQVDRSIENIYNQLRAWYFQFIHGVFGSWK